MKCWRGALFTALVALAFTAEVEVLKETLSEAECTAVVKKVQESGKYTEESIQPICNQEVKSSKCDFFSEALSLASSHSDFDSKVFCKDIAEAHFCSQTMDHVLSSAPVSDLAFGECLRAHESKGQTYCLKFEKMLAYAVQNDDLDTMRACYMIEAYEDLGGAEKKDEKVAEKPAEKAIAAPEQPPAVEEAKIVNGSHTKLDSVGKGSKPTTSTTAAPEKIVGQSGIVVRPKPLDPIGEGKANASHKVADEPGNIITEPEPVSNIAVRVRRTLAKKHVNVSRNVAIAPTSTGVATEPREPVAKTFGVKHHAEKAQKGIDRTSFSASAKPKMLRLKATSVLQPTDKVSPVQPHNKAPITATKHVTGNNSPHRAGLASVRRKVQQKGKVTSKGGKKSGKARKEEGNDKYGGFLSAFVR